LVLPVPLRLESDGLGAEWNDGEPELNLDSVWVFERNESGVTEIANRRVRNAEVIQVIHVSRSSSPPTAKAT
jgi:hypothetical protein